MIWSSEKICSGCWNCLPLQRSPPSWCKPKSRRGKLERQRQYQLSLKVVQRLTTDNQRHIPTCGAFSGGQRRNVTSEEPGLKLLISDGGFNLRANAIMCASLRHWSAVSFERAAQILGSQILSADAKSLCVVLRPLLPPALPSPRCAAALGNVMTEQNKDVDRAHADRFSREARPLNVEYFLCLLFPPFMNSRLWFKDFGLGIATQALLQCRLLKLGAAPSGPPEPLGARLNTGNMKLSIRWTKPHNRLDSFLLRSETLQGVCPHAVPQARRQVVFGAGHFSWEGTGRWNHAWQRVCGSMRVEIMLLIPSAAAVQDFGRALASPANTGASGHPEAARPDVQLSGMRRAALSLTLQTLNNVHRSLRLMSPPYRAHGGRALPAVSIRSSVSGEQSFLCLRWHRTRELDTKCKSALSSLRWLQCVCVTRWWCDSFRASGCRMWERGERVAGLPVEC